MRSFWSAAARAVAFAAFLVTAAVAQTQPAQAPQPFADQSRRLDGVRATLDQIEQSMARKDVDDATLQDLRARLDALARETQDVLAGLQPRLAAAKARLDQLGPRPAAGAPPESADVAADRDDQQRQFDAVDGILKRGALFTQQIAQDSDAVTQLRRERFTRALFARTQSILDPRLWAFVVSEAPGDWRALRTVSSDWLSNVASKDGGDMALLIGGLLAIALAYPFCIRLGRRANLRDPEVHDPTPARKATAAVWGAAVDIVTPIAAAFAAAGLLRSFGVFSERLEPLTMALLGGVVRVAVANGVARAALAPGLVNWRPLALTDATADRLYRLTLAVVAVITTTRMLEALVEIIAAQVRTSVALRGAGAVVAAALVALMLRGLATPAEDEECLPPRVSGGPDWRDALRMLAWVDAATVIVAAAIGYNAFAAFLVIQSIWIAFLGASLHLLIGFANEAIATNLQPRSRFGRSLMTSIGLRRESLEQIAVLLSGAISVALIIVAGMLALAPWGVESDDLLGDVRAAFFGFKVGEVTISLSSVAIAAALFGLGIGAARALRNWLDARFLPHTQLDAGLRNSIGTSINYIGFVLASMLGLSYLGLSFDKIAIVAGALSVGIGFGLQSIVNNFVSGLIILWERAIRVGDWVVLGDEQGYVRRINVRSTEIETFDRAMMIVPNSNLVSGVVKNWVRNDHVGRIRNPVTVAVDTDPEKVRAALLACAGEHEGVQKFPAPGVLFTAMEGALKFELVCFVGDVERSARIKSDLNFEMFRRLKEAGVAPFAPPPAATTMIALNDIERIERLLGVRPSNETSAEK